MKFFFFKGLIFSHLFMSEVINRVVKSSPMHRREAAVCGPSGARVGVPAHLPAGVRGADSQEEHVLGEGVGLLQVTPGQGAPLAHTPLLCWTWVGGWGSLTWPVRGLTLCLVSCSSRWLPSNWLSSNSSCRCSSSSSSTSCLCSAKASCHCHPASPRCPCSPFRKVGVDTEAGAHFLGPACP